MYRRDLKEILEICGIPDSARGFWNKYPERFCTEMEKMLNGTNARASYEDGKLIFIEEIINNYGTPFTTLIVVPQNFPFKGPKVFLLEPEITHNEGKHMYDDNSLCLYHPSKYSSNWSLLQIRNQACCWCTLIENYQKTGNWGGAEAAH